MSDLSDGFADALATLNALRLSDDGLAATLEGVAELACSTVAGCDSSGVTVEREGTPTTVASTGTLAVPLDQAQYRVDDGPCLAAYRDRRIVHVADVGADDRWPAFAAAADEVGAACSLSMPFAVDEQQVGALNLYSRTRHAFSEMDIRVAELFGAQASVAIANAELYRRAVLLTENLQTALESRDLIGQAKGVLIAQRKISAEDAFDAIRLCSQTLNVKVRDVAEHLVETGELPTSSWNLAGGISEARTG